ncbi:MAG: methyl-accepting chemotaxis protein [Rickettsiaceae bacterium]|jgi:methyl-accepting chemotaxis protein|nr:methyl-accepting chemotaxis protein [Rickettsiaceae bacterium]
MLNKSFLGNISNSVKVFINLSLITIFIIIQALLNHHLEGTVRYNYETMLMQKDALSIHREELSYKSLQAKLLYGNFVNNFPKKNSEAEIEEFSVLLKEMEEICETHFIAFDNGIGLTAAQVKDALQTIRGNLSNLNNRNNGNFRDKLSTFKLEASYGIDNILNKIGNKNLINLYENILQAEYAFIKKSQDKRSYEILLAHYAAFKEALSRLGNIKNKDELASKMAVKLENVKKIAGSVIELEDLKNELSNSVDKLITLNKDLQLAIDDESKDKISDSQSLRETLGLLIYFLYLISLVQIISSFFIIKSSIIEPVKDIAEAAQEMTAGNLISVPYTDNNDEVGRIAKALKMLQIDIRDKHLLEEKSKQLHFNTPNSDIETKNIKAISEEFVGQIKHILNEVLKDSNKLYISSEDINSSFNNTIAVINKVLISSESTSQNIQVVASATEELSSSVKEIASQATNSTIAFKDMVEKAEKADISINNLNQATKEISSIIQIITDITEQINLLALNATIESARAGEAGRGFAVVASEIKNLASETSKATEQIFNQVEGIQQVSKSVVNGLKDIKASIDHVNQYSSSIASAVEEQSSVTTEISGNMNNASKVTVNIKENIVEINSNASQAQAYTGELLATSKSIKDNLVNLQSSIEKFFAEVSS